MCAARSTSREAASTWLGVDSGNFDHFKSLVDQVTNLDDTPLAAEIVQNIPIYDGRFVDQCADDPDQSRALMGEWCTILGQGSGIIAVKAAFADTGVIDLASKVFSEIIHQQHNNADGGGGDHFAAGGANDRIWNSLEKHCLANPENFARYFACPTLSLGSIAWLGPSYQMTAQVNLVRPGGKAQVPHRDYHLGFMRPEKMMRYPAHIHDISPLLTLQGAVAHCDMPIESGPTMLLPHSQKFREGYLAFGREEYQEYFAQHHVQLPLQKGDVLFFNPAVMHGAGNNVSADIQRMANLLQVSSAFGRAMEAVDRNAMCKALYPKLCKMFEDGLMSHEQLAMAVASCAEGYSFPTNLDRDPPTNGLAPKTQHQIMIEAVEGGWSLLKLESEIDLLSRRQSSN
jgi:ectoine hydroxylase-related dioxygenase (phytanoyl-CoA dioxygenase family)